MEKDKEKSLHSDYSLIVNLIEEHASVLDLGCGDGVLLKKLVDEKQVKGKGIEISQDKVIESIHKGLSVIQGDIDEGLADFSDGEMDYVVLNQTLQSVQKPDYVIREMLRVGKNAIVGFPNFAYWRIRTYLLFKGKMPKTTNLPFEWYDTPNIHLLTVKDFFEYCKQRNIKIVKAIFTRNGKEFRSGFKKFFADIYAENVLFIIHR